MRMILCVLLFVIVVSTPVCDVISDKISTIRLQLQHIRGELEELKTILVEGAGIGCCEQIDSLIDLILTKLHDIMIIEEFGGPNGND